MSQKPLSKLCTRRGAPAFLFDVHLDVVHIRSLRVAQFLPRGQSLAVEDQMHALLRLNVSDAAEHVDDLREFGGLSGASASSQAGRGMRGFLELTGLTTSL